MPKTLEQIERKAVRDAENEAWLWNRSYSDIELRKTFREHMLPGFHEEMQDLALAGKVREVIDRMNGQPWGDSRPLTA